MKTLKSWALYVLTQILIFGLLKAWKLDGNEHAGNLLQAILWTFAAAGLISVFMDARGTIERHGAARLIIGKTNVTVLIVLLAWFGHFALAFCYVLGLLGVQAYRDRFDAEGKPLPPAPPDSVRSES